jgi:DNA-directed RNA polymerase subunit H (RpoH/RPB5)
MGELNINDLQPSMVLAQDVKNKHGLLLLRKEKALTGKDISLLKIWGISEADIRGIDREQVVKEETNALPGDVVELIENEFNEFFPPVVDNPVMEEIYRVVKRFGLKEAAAQVSEIK